MEFVKERLNKLLKVKSLTQKDFCKKIGFSEKNLSNFLTGTTKTTSIELLVGIALHLQDINLRWVLTGEGEMLVNNSISTTINGGISQIGNINGQGGKNTISPTMDADKEKMAALQQKVELQEQLIISLRENIILLRQMLDK